MFGPAIGVLLDGEFQLRNGWRVFVLSHVSAGERLMPVLPRGIHAKELVIFSNRGIVLALRKINARQVFADGRFRGRQRFGFIQFGNTFVELLVFAEQSSKTAM